MDSFAKPKSKNYSASYSQRTENVSLQEKTTENRSFLSAEATADLKERIQSLMKQKNRLTDSDKQAKILNSLIEAQQNRPVFVETNQISKVTSVSKIDNPDHTNCIPDSVKFVQEEYKPPKKIIKISDQPQVSRDILGSILSQMDQPKQDADTKNKAQISENKKSQVPSNWKSSAIPSNQQHPTSLLAKNQEYSQRKPVENNRSLTITPKPIKQHNSSVANDHYSVVKNKENDRPQPARPIQRHQTVAFANDHYSVPDKTVATMFNFIGRDFEAHWSAMCSYQSRRQPPQRQERLQCDPRRLVETQLVQKTSQCKADIKSHPSPAPCTIASKVSRKDSAKNATDIPPKIVNAKRMMPTIDMKKERYERKPTPVQEVSQCKADIKQQSNVSRNDNVKSDHRILPKVIDVKRIMPAMKKERVERKSPQTVQKICVQKNRSDISKKDNIRSDHVTPHKISDTKRTTETFDKKKERDEKKSHPVRSQCKGDIKSQPSTVPSVQKIRSNVSRNDTVRSGHGIPPQIVNVKRILPIFDMEKDERKLDNSSCIRSVLIMDLDLSESDSD